MTTQRPIARAALTAGCLLALFAMVAGTDLVLWRTADHGAEPIRALTHGDQDYYILLAKDAVAGGAIGSPFFQEHRLDPPRFALFERLVAFLGSIASPLVGANATVWGDIIRALAIAALFFGWRHVFRRWAGLSWPHATIAALCVNLWQEAYDFRSFFALDSWFLPIVLAGLICLVRAFRSENAPSAVGWTLAASLLFAVHPIAFAVGAGAAGFLWLGRLWKRRDLDTLFQAVLWGIPTVLLGLTLFGAFVLPDPAAAAIAVETWARNDGFATRLPVLPLTHVKLLASLVVIIVLRRHDGGRRGAWNALMAFAAAMLIGVSSNIFTGRYFIGDHFAFFDRVIVVIVGALALTMPESRFTRRERTVAGLAGLGFAAYGIGLLADHPVRSWLTLGVHLPYFLAAAAAILVVFGKQVRVSAQLVPAIIAVSLLYPALFLWRLERGYLPAYRAAEDARPAIEALRALPPGVVLADDALSGLLTMYTDDRPYWTARAFGESASDEELRSRWRDALVVFGDQAWLTGPAAKTGLYGNRFCGSSTDRFLYLPLVRLGLMKASPLCQGMPDDGAWAAIVEQASAAAMAERGGAWTPRYGLEYLLLDAGKGERLPDGLETKFMRVDDAGGYSLYRFIP